MNQRYFPMLFVVSLAMIASMVAVIAQPLTANAYTLSGIRWINNYSIPYQIDAMGQPKDTTAANFGIGVWDSSPAPVLFSRGTPGVEMYDEDDGANNTPGWHYPITKTGQFCKNGDKIFDEAFIVLNTYYTSKYIQGKVDEVAAHELGHGIGLDHVNDQRQLMYYNTSNYDKYGINTPQSDDINGAKAIYSSPC